MSGGPLLVTGARGWLGSALAARLAELGRTVHAWDLEQGDITRCRWPDGPIERVFHLAARTFVPDSWKKPEPFYETNVLGTVHVLELCRERGAALTLFSSYLYGPPERMPIDEQHPVNPFNPYNHTKILAEEVAHFWNRHFQVPVTVLRPFNPYGPGQPRQFVIPTIVAHLLDPSCPAVEMETLEPKRDFIYFEDVVEAAVLTLGCDGGIYNVASGSSASVQELAHLLMEVSGIQKPIRARGQLRPNEVMDITGDSARLRRDLGWAPRTPLREGLRRVVDSMRAAHKI